MGTPDLTSRTRLIARRGLAVALLAGCSPSGAGTAPGQTQTVTTPPPVASHAPSLPRAVPPAPVPPDAGHVDGQPFFAGGVQMMQCEAASPPVPLDGTHGSQSACWYAGASCASRGEQAFDPFALKGTVVEGHTTHGGCNPGNFSLLYEPGTSPLKLRVCVKRGPPVDCPAMVNDGARWDVAPLLDANHTARAVLLRPPGVQ